jgi:maltose-binding protein MalE
MKIITFSSAAVVLLAVAVDTAAVDTARATEPADNVTVTIDRWRKPGSNNIGTADITINNSNNFAVKDIKVRCNYVVKAGGKKIETEQNITVTVKPKSKMSFKKTKFPFIDVQAAEGSCKVLGATQI